jgi:hypothetical protein
VFDGIIAIFHTLRCFRLLHGASRPLASPSLWSAHRFRCRAF